MRNIKITALLLAVLMVVTAFAGCASKSAVSDLDNKVQEQANALAGIQESLKDLAAAIEDDKGSSELDDIKADVEANKQSVADILAAIEGLKDAVAGATGESEDVKTAVNQAGAKIDALKDEYAANKAHYTAEDYATIVATLGAAQAAISTCVTAEAVAAELATMTASLEKCVRVDDSIYAYYVALKGNITDKSAELAEEADDALEAAVKFYKKADLKVNPLVAYETEEDDEFPLAAELEALIEAQTGTDKGTLAYVKSWAEDLVEDIDEAAEKFDEEALEDLYDEYRDFVKEAKKLSEENVALVTNADKLTAALASAENISSAIAALDKAAWEITSLLKATYGDYVQIFADYNTLAAAPDKQAVFTFESAKKSGKTLKSEMALTIKIYDAIDDKLAELAEDYELTDAAVAFVVDAYAASKSWGEEYYARYEADKALVEAFEAEYEKLAEGIFADIKDLASARLTATSALDLVEKYEANRDAINKWAADLVAAYKAEYKALKDKDTVNFTDAEYPALVEANFNAMAVAAELGNWELVEVETDEYEWQYKGYTGGLDDADTNFYYDLYAFDYAADLEDGTEGVLGKFLRVDFPAAYAAAKRINKAIKDFKVDQANSIVDLLVKVGGYYAGTVVEEGKTMLKPIVVAAGATDPYAADTIANFVFKYKTENYDLTGMIDVAVYNEKLAGVEKAIEDAEKALAELVASYKALLGDNNNVIVTMDNADEIIKLEALLIKAKAAANVNVMKAIVEDTKDGLNVYELKAIVTEFLAEGQTAEEFYNAILLSTDYTDTVAGSVDTGAITRLVYQARALKKEALYVESAYKVIKSLNDATGGKAFAYTTLNDASALMTNLNAAEGSLKTDAYLYGIFGFDVAERKTSTGATEYQATAKMVRFSVVSGFYQGSLAGEWCGDKNAAIRSAIMATKTKNVWVYNAVATGDATADAQAFYTLMFETIANDVKNTDSESLSALWGNGTKFFLGYTLPMIATYLEAKFIINNMGQTTDAITAAKAGWGEPTSNYGFEYNKAMVANMLRVGAKLDAAELATIGNALNYSGITRAILNINEAREDAAKIKFDIAFGHADATWLSETYDITKVDYYTNGAVAAPAGASTYADHGINLAELVIDVISIWDYEPIV